MKTPDDIIRPEIKALHAYHVADSDGMLKLDAMENPYALPAELAGAIAQRVAAAPLNRYPDAAARVVKARLRSAMQIAPDLEIVVGNGSDELIQMLALVVARAGATLLGLEPSFVMFRIIATVVGMRYVGVPLRSDFALDRDATLAAIEEHRPALIFIAYPNNPTGNLFDERAISDIIGAAPGIVVLDEAYHAFAGRTFMTRVAEFDNLLVMRTMSKLGLAGLRLGVLAGSARWLAHVDKVRLPYNVSVLTQLVATEVLEHGAVLDAQAAAIRSERAALLNGLRNISGIEAYPSDANFILFKVAQANAVYAGLKERRVLIKSLTGSHTLLENCLRVTVGTAAENTQFLNALAAVVAAASA